MGFARDEGEGPWAITAVNEAGFESAYSNQVERPVVFPYSPDTHDLRGATGGSWDTADLDSWGPWDIDTNEMLPDGHPDYGTLPTLQLYLFMPGGLASDSLYAMTRSGKPFNLLPPVNGVQPMFTFMGNHTITGTDYSLYGYGYGARLADLNKGSSSTGHAEMMWVIKGPDGQLYRPETLPDDLNAYLHYPSGIGFDGWRMEFTVKVRNQGDDTSWQEIVANATGSSATKVVEDAPQVFRWQVDAAPLSVSGNPIGMFEIYKYTNQSTFANDLSPEEINLGNIISHSGLNPSINAVWPVYNHALPLGTVRVLYDGNTSYSVPVEGENLIIAEYGPDVSMQAFISAFNDQTPPDLNANWVNASDPSRGLDPGDDFPLDQGYNSNEGSFEGKQPKAYALNFGHVEMFLDTDGLNGNQYSLSLIHI